MKKKFSIIVLAASLLAVLTVLLCENPDVFDNPLDKDGGKNKNYLYGDTTDEKKKLDVGADGEAKLFDTSEFKICDGRDPTLTLKVGPIETMDSGDVSKFNRLMNFDGSYWKELIEFTKGDGTVDPVPVEPCLSKGADRDGCIPWPERNKTPGEGDYNIRYKVAKPKCNNKIPTAVKDLSLRINKYEAPDSGTPVIVVQGQTAVEIRSGETYEDRGATVSVGGTSNFAWFDSVVVTGPGDYRVKSTGFTSLDDFKTKVKIPANPTAGSTYTITYYASYTSPSGKYPKTYDTKARTVSVLVQQSKEPAVIVLAGYAHKLKSGKTVYYPDTMMLAGGRSTNEDYERSEKGVDKVYWLNAGVETPLDKNSVERTLPSNFITGQTVIGGGTGKVVTYKIPGGNGYDAGEARRNVFLVDPDCEEATKEPTINIPSSSSNEIQAGKVWDYAASWTVVNNNTEDGTLGNTGYKYFIDFNGLDPNNPKAGTYKITYVGLGKCGGTSELERTITVK